MWSEINQSIYKQLNFFDLQYERNFRTKNLLKNLGHIENIKKKTKIYQKRRMKKD